jgi:hypothetical protein
MGARRRHALARLARRGRWTGDDDQVFAGQLGGYLDPSALWRRYKQALRTAGCATCASTTAPNVRHPGHRHRLDPQGQGVDGPRRRRHDDALPALRAVRPATPSSSPRRSRRGRPCRPSTCFTSHRRIEPYPTDAVDAEASAGGGRARNGPVAATVPAPLDARPVRARATTRRAAAPCGQHARAPPG